MTLQQSGGVTRPVLFGVTAIGMLSLTLAHAHGPAAWIQQGGYKNGLGELCCGERDCVELAAADIQITPGGYVVKATSETIPFSEATPLPTGTFWRCDWGGQRKCFFAPPGST